MLIVGKIQFIYLIKFDGYFCIFRTANRGLNDILLMEFLLHSVSLIFKLKRNQVAVGTETRIHMICHLRWAKNFSIVLEMKFPLFIRSLLLHSFSLSLPRTNTRIFCYFFHLIHSFVHIIIIIRTHTHTHPFQCGRMT